MNRAFFGWLGTGLSAPLWRHGCFRLGHTQGETEAQWGSWVMRQGSRTFLGKKNPFRRVRPPFFWSGTEGKESSAPRVHFASHGWVAALPHALPLPLPGARGTQLRKASQRGAHLRPTPFLSRRAGRREKRLDRHRSSLITQIFTCAQSVLGVGHVLVNQTPRPLRALERRTAAPKPHPNLGQPKSFNLGWGGVWEEPKLSPYPVLSGCSLPTPHPFGGRSWLRRKVGNILCSWIPRLCLYDRPYSTPPTWRPPFKKRP